MNFDVLTLLPEFFESPLKCGVIGRAINDGSINVALHNIREHTLDKHRTTDDAPYGGGAGMVMKVEPVAAAIEGLGLAKCGTEGEASEIKVLLTPQGEPFTQDLAHRLSTYKRVVLVCGRYEGFDERIRSRVDMELSVGDYVLSGGESAALTVIDSVGRLIPGVLGGETSTETDSFSPALMGLLEFPQYTRPEEFQGEKVPDVLLSGNHEDIRKWRLRKSIENTVKKRPDIIAKIENTELLTDEAKRLLFNLKKK